LSSSSNEMNGNLLEKNERSLYDDSQNDYSDNQFIDDSISKILNVSLNKQLFNLNDLIEFNISVYYPNGTACSSFTTNISTRPHEIISSSTTQNNISGNFTATKQGMYSLIINVTDNFNNSVKRKYMFYVDADSTKTVNYYLRPDVGPIHGQPTENDARSLLFEAPTNESYFFCGTWVQASPDNVNINFPVCLKDINISSWYKVGGTPLMGVERYVIYDYGVDENQSIPTAVEYEWIKVNFTNLNWSLDYITDWYWLSVKLKGDLIYWYTNATHPSYVNISYLYTDTPEIMNISNENAQILSATMASGSSDALIQLDGTSSTNITVQMPDSDLFYAAEYDGTDCGNTNDCNFTQSNGLLEFSLALGSEHNLTISQGTPEENKFEIKDPNGITVASIDSVGNMFIKGTLAQCTGVDSVPTQNSFIIENNAGTPVVYINSSGYAFIVGSLYQHSIMTLTGSNLEIRDNTNSLVAFIDSSGNIKLSGQIVENYDNP